MCCGYQGRRPGTGGHFLRSRFVDVIGTSKGRGFAGVVRRHGFAGGPSRTATCFRCRARLAPLVILLASFPPAHAWHMGAEQVTVRNLRIRGIDLEENLLMVEARCPEAAKAMC